MTPTEELVLESMARTTSAVSLVSCLFILLTFAFFPTFRKPINRLIVYASIGNILTNIATVISVSGIPSHGASWSLCRFQGFFIQMFMPADSLWTFCMALNVYLTFFKNYNAIDLRNLELRYFIASYGICFIPALIYLALDQSSLKMGIYGDAVLWCWVGRDWEWMRIAFFYGPVWVVIAVTIGIYGYTGRVIFKQRKALRAFSRSNDQSASFPQIKNPFTANAVTAITEVVVTSEAIQSEDHLRPRDIEADARSSFSSTRKLSGTTAGQSTYRNNSEPSDNQPFQYEPNSAVWPYSNAVSGGKGDPKNVFSTSVSAGAPMPAELLLDFEGPRPTSSGNANRKGGGGGSGNRHASDAAWGYAKVAFLMFVALFVVWIPSTVNRVYALANPDNPNFALNVVAAFVLPLQGFWNCTIYVSTSWSQTKDAFADVHYLISSGFTRKKKRYLNADLEMNGAPQPKPRPNSSISDPQPEQRHGGSYSHQERAVADEKDAITPCSTRPPTSSLTSESGLTGH
ncbi:G-protein coupled receptor [Lasiodiplodia theobromae]|uniref:G-protein coupled receptor n=1 Tax=Lasiodiplodia theobromae TaxID=45133 RepID=UPI0015C32932|nr:G-protein coupled receptor [Lasiodiplodia theobromae]KAF4541843.1 G-protein coupled receptor [Lasiodiplodia theobromae]